MTEAQIKAPAIPEGLSEQAKALVCGMFFSGTKATVRSHPPHAFFLKNAEAFGELLSHGLITSASYNDYGVVEYRGTEPCETIWRTHGRERFEAQANEILGKE